MWPVCLAQLLARVGHKSRPGVDYFNCRSRWLEANCENEKKEPCQHIYFEGFTSHEVFVLAFLIIRIQLRLLLLHAEQKAFAAFGNRRMMDPAFHVIPWSA